MLKSYEAIYDHGRLQWLGEAPRLHRQRVLVVVEADEQTENADLEREDAIRRLAQETCGAWGKHSAEETAAWIERQRATDWGDDAR